MPQAAPPPCRPPASWGLPRGRTGTHSRTRSLHTNDFIASRHHKVSPTEIVVSDGQAYNGACVAHKLALGHLPLDLHQPHITSHTLPVTQAAYVCTCTHQRVVQVGAQQQHGVCQYVQRLCSDASVQSVPRHTRTAHVGKGVVAVAVVVGKHVDHVLQRLAGDCSE